MMNLGLGNDDAQGNAPAANDMERDLAEILKRETLTVTGIGARETPDDVLALMTRIAAEFEQRGAVLRSGGAGGADLAFEKGFRNANACEIFHPWRGFKPGKDMTDADVNKILGRKRPHSGVGSPIVIEGEKLAEAEEIAARFHPAWENCSQGARKLHTRNVPQVLGANLNEKTDLVICWTADGRASGGTGQAMRMAEHMNVRVVNLKRQSDRNMLLTALGMTEKMRKAA